jgi:O-antigen/teichoic acid export membrane protein
MLRPLRLIRFDSDEIVDTSDSPPEIMDRQVREELYHASSGPLQMSGPLPPLSGILEEMPPSEAEAQKLLKRTPRSYLLNQAYGFWFFASWFFLTIIITRTLNNTDYGVYAVALSAFNTIAYVVALGLEDATVTFVPRVLAEHGQAAAALLSRRLLGLRIAILMLSVVIMVFTLPLLAALIAIIPIQGSGNVAAGLRDPKLLGHILPIAIYVLGNGISGLLTALCAAVMRMRIVFIIGGITQLLLLIIGFIVLHLGWGVDGMLWLLAVSSLLNALAFALWQAPFLFARGATYKQAMKPVVRLGISAWLTNLVSGALLKQVSIILLGYFAISLVQIGYFNLSFQLAHSANLLLVAGFGGVGGSALAASFIGKNYERLAVSWQTLIKIESLLAAPVLVFCLFNAQNIATTLYGTNFDPVGPLLAIFLFFNIFVRVLGTTIHQSTLYVVGRARLVVLSQWVGLIVVILLGLLLIPLNGPTHGPAGALVADGLAQVITGALLLVFLARDLPRKYPLGFTLRLLLALTIAALPSIIWHPTNRILLGISGGIFLILSFGLLLLIKPLSAEDLEMIADVNPMVAKYLKWFARGQRI